MKYQKRPFKRMAAQVITYGTLAAFLTIAPPVYDSDSGFLSYPAAHASSCFISGTRILMADGSWQSIEKVRPGDRVVGEGGRINRVTEVERVKLESRRLYGFNGGTPFVTAEHPFMTPQGWKSIDPAMTAAETPTLRVESLAPGDEVMRVTHYASASGGIDGALAQVLEPLLELVTERLVRIDSVEADPETPLFNLLLDGNHSYIADDYLVHNKGGDDGGDSGGGDSGGGDSGGGDGGGGDSGGGDDGDDSSGPGGGDDGDDDDSSGSGSDDDDGDDSSGSGSDDDDGDDSSGSRSGDDDDSRGSGSDDNDSADDSDDRGDDIRGRGRGRGSHGFDDSMDDSFDGPDDSDGRRSDDQSLDDDGDRDRREERSDRVRTETRIGLETDPDFQRTRTEQRFDDEGNLTRERTETRIGQETSADFQRTRTEQRFDDQGDLTRDRVSTQIGPDDDDNPSQDDSPSTDDSRNRSLSEATITPSGPDLSPEEEAAAISNGWQ